jgi:thiosulfate/3-mercaptopyruvate sulfurtransferase
MNVMVRFWLAIPLVLLSPFAPVASATEANLARLVTFDQLEKRLGEQDLRILDARPKADYDKGHIPGAVWVDAKAVETRAAKPGALTDRAAWEKWIALLGIGPKTNILIYDARRQLDAARLWWLLSYLGVERVGLIDGNFPLWASEKRPVTTLVPDFEPRAFKVAFRDDRHATQAEVLSAVHSKSAVVVDARSEAEYTGREKRAKRAGHIPSACSIEWTNLVGPDGRFLDDLTLRTKLTKAGVKAEEPVITHCQGGGRASVDAFVLERLGFKTKNYYLGWSDWGNASETPIEVETASESKK